MLSQIRSVGTSLITKFAMIVNVQNMKSNNNVMQDVNTNLDDENDDDTMETYNCDNTNSGRIECFWLCECERECERESSSARKSTKRLL